MSLHSNTNSKKLKSKNVVKVQIYMDYLLKGQVGIKNYKYYHNHNQDSFLLNVQIFI